MSGLNSDDMLAFRHEVRTACTAMLPADVKRKVQLGFALEKDELVNWEKALASKGWLAGHWPREYGGQGWSPLQRYIFLEETMQLGAPKIPPFGINYVGPVIYTYGTEEQKARFLPGILNSETWWAQGYSEPGAGSDLAALTTRAVREGDFYRVTGQKTWTTSAHWADMMFSLVRTEKTDRPQQGISFLLIDMKSPGVTVRPIITIDGGHEVNDVFLDDVMVPVENLIGQEGSGWTYGKFLLSNERMSTIGAIGRAKSMMVRLHELSQKVWEQGAPLAEHRGFQRQAAELEISLSVLEAMCVRQIENAVAGATPGVEASILKLRSTQLTQSIAQHFASLLMRLGLPYDKSEFSSPFDDEAETFGLLRTHLSGRASTIFGGAAEVQRNIIAKTALGL
jgi:alkylation response protein AidB-like acyl-CoA dehydrogenase